MAEQSKVRREIAKHKNRAIIPALSALADEIEQREKDGTLSKEMKGMKAGSLIGHLTRIIQAIKESAPLININKGEVSQQDPTWLRAHSATNMTPKEREMRRYYILEGEKADGKEKEALDSVCNQTPRSSEVKGCEGGEGQREGDDRPGMAGEQGIGK